MYLIYIYIFDGNDRSILIKKKTKEKQKGARPRSFTTKERPRANHGPTTPGPLRLIKRKKEGHAYNVKV